MIILGSKRGLAAAILLVLFGVMLVRTAWICDDAYITFRTVDNFVGGYGLTWNVEERVQAYTNPLWMFLMSGIYLITRDVYYSSICLSIALSLVVFAMMGRRFTAHSNVTLFSLALLILSKAFVDYSTSGLENPLTHLLVITFLVVYYSFWRTPRWGFTLFLLASGAALNRLDTLILLLPLLLHTGASLRPRKALVPALSGFLPLIVWEIFSLWYYGFPVPNTAYAKLNTGIGAAYLIEHGAAYFIDSLTVDTVTLLTIATGVVLALLRRNQTNRCVAFGIILYLFYVMSIGGDFMSGRFFALPMMVSVTLIAQSSTSTQRLYPKVLLGLLCIIGLFVSGPKNMSGSAYGEYESEGRKSTGIADMRKRAYQLIGLLSQRRRTLGMDLCSYQPARTASDRVVITDRAIGIPGFCAGPAMHIVDLMALTDPLLARLPAQKVPAIEIGHFPRELPKGYMETLRRGENRIADRRLALFYDKLRIITRGDLLDTRRFVEILKMNFGLYRQLIDRDLYANPVSATVSISELRTPWNEGSGRDSEGLLVIPHGSLEILLPAVRHLPLVEATLQGGRTYVILYLRRKTVIARQILTVDPASPDTLILVRTAVPNDAVTQGFRAIRIMTLTGDDGFAVGHLQLRRNDRRYLQKGGA